MHWCATSQVLGFNCAREQDLLTCGSTELKDWWGIFGKIRTQTHNFRNKRFDTARFGVALIYFHVRPRNSWLLHLVEMTQFDEFAGATRNLSVCLKSLFIRASANPP